MASNKKVRVDRIIIIVLVIILVILMLIFGIGFVIKYLGKTDSNNNNNPNPNKPNQQEVTTDGINITLNDYQVYIDDTGKLGFNFVVAELKFEGEQAINFELKNLQTSEKISLDGVNTYINDIESNGYKLTKLNIVDYVTSKENSCVANVFIPVTSKANMIQIYNLNNPATNITIDLEENNKVLTTLKFDTEQTIDVENTNVTVSSCSISTTMTHNGEEYYIPSTTKVFTFKIYVNDVDEDVSIDEAYFIKDGEDEKIECMNSEYNSMKVENIIGKTLIKGENGALFFETYCKEDKPDYSGILMIKFSNGNEWVKVPTVLE